MGRYYSGDIEGKFWFALQSSEDAENFGALAREDHIQSREDHIQYYISNDEKDGEVKEGIEECLDVLGESKERLDNFFDKNNRYNDKIAVDFWKDEYDEELDTDKFRSLLVVYARLELGRKIEEYFKKNPDDDCYFEAEC